MAQLFQPSLNTVCKAVPFAAILIVVSITWVDWTWQRSSWQTSQGRFVDQQVPFSHLHHVRGLGIDCRFCHTGVETSSYAGLPPRRLSGSGSSAALQIDDARGCRFARLQAKVGANPLASASRRV